MSDTTEEKTPTTDAPAETPAETTPQTSTDPAVVTTPDTNATEVKNSTPAPEIPETGVSSLAVAGSTVGALGVFGATALGAATGPLGLAIGAGVVVAGVGAGMLRARRAATDGHRARGEGRRGRTRTGRGSGSRRRARVTGVGGTGKRASALRRAASARRGAAGAAKRSAGRTGATKRPLGATPKRHVGTRTPTRGKSLAQTLGRSPAARKSTGRAPGRGGKSLLSGGKSGSGSRRKNTSGPKNNRSKSGKGSSKGTGGRIRSLLGGSNGPGRTKRSKGKDHRSKGKGSGSGRKDKRSKSRRTPRRWWRWIAGIGKYSGGQLRRVGWWLWGPKSKPAPKPLIAEDSAPAEPAKKPKKPKGAPRVDPDGETPRKRPTSSNPPRGISTAGGSDMANIKDDFFAGSRDALQADFARLRNVFQDVDRGGWSDTKDAMRSLAALFEQLGLSGRVFADDNDERGGYVGGFAEVVRELSGHSLGIGDRCHEALDVVRTGQKELVEYAEDGRGGRFDQSTNND
jgi:hypothetical protein